jgi:acyl carrier protein
MSMLYEEELSSLIREWIIRNQQSPNSTRIDAKEDMDLIANGVLDSMGFIELLVYIESVTGNKIDLSDLDPIEFTSIRGLSRSVLNLNKKT